jgi:asparagine synthase (glutamine-hydrolysing)
MCGFNGFTFHDSDLLQRMHAATRHRGPDDQGFFEEASISFSHNRLSIIDLSEAGRQPMSTPDGRFTIVFNGEIYNYLELKEVLKDKYSFKTKSDTEVILAAYSVWGEDCLSKFNGDFSFVIYDVQEKVFFGARDRFGVKPFYYHQNQTGFYFASEIKALLPKVASVEPNNKSIFEYLVYNRTDQSHETFFKK